MACLMTLGVYSEFFFILNFILNLKLAGVCTFHLTGAWWDNTIFFLVTHNVLPCVLYSLNEFFLQKVHGLFYLKA